MATKEQSQEVARQAQRIWDEAHRNKKDLTGVVNIRPDGVVVAEVDYVDKEKQEQANS